MKLFIIEDDAAVRGELAAFFEKYGYLCGCCDDFADAAGQALRFDADAVLLDINLPRKDGFQLCRELRQRSDVPIIVLTARDTDYDELMSLSLGADDFISKPYNAQVLLARLQRLQARSGAVLTHKGLRLDLAKAEMSCGGKALRLTKNELGILRLLMSNKGRVIPREEIIEALWQSEQFIDENTLNVNIVRLRKALAEIGLPDYLETRRGLGYCV